MDVEEGDCSLTENLRTDWHFDCAEQEVLQVKVEAGLARMMDWLDRLAAFALVDFESLQKDSWYLKGVGSLANFERTDFEEGGNLEG